MKVAGNQQQVLKIVAELGEADKAAISRRMVVSLQFVENLCNALIKEGYLSETPGGGYKITRQGQEVLKPYRTTGPVGIGRRAAAAYPTLPPPG